MPKKSRSIEIIGDACSICAAYHAVNEDAVLCDNGRHIYGVFDGVGGRDNGALAAQTAVAAVRAVSQPFSSGALVLRSKSRAENVVRKIMEVANNAVLSAAERRTSDMGTTGCVALVSRTRQGQAFVTVGNCGDSRAYVVRVCTLRHLTLDDSGYAEYVDLTPAQHRDIQAALAAAHQTEDLERSIHRLDLRFLFQLRNQISTWLGKSPARFCVSSHILEAGDRLILATDGVHDNLTDGEIIKAAHQGEPDHAVRSLVDRALTRSRKKGAHIRSKADDISAVVVTISQR